MKSDAVGVLLTLNFPWEWQERRLNELHTDHLLCYITPQTNSIAQV